MARWKMPKCTGCGSVMHAMHTRYYGRINRVGYYCYQCGSYIFSSVTTKKLLDKIYVGLKEIKNEKIVSPGGNFYPGEVKKYLCPKCGKISYSVFCNGEIVKLHCMRSGNINEYRLESVAEAI